MRRLALALSVATACVLTTSPNATISGEVTIDGVPAPGITVEAVFSDEFTQAVTDAAGRYTMPVTSGFKRVRIASISLGLVTPQLVCVPVEVEIEIRGGESKTASFSCFDVRPYTATVTGGYDHNSGTPGQSLECKLIATNPPRPGATYDMTVEGPTEGGNSGVVPGQPAFTGTLDANGTARVTVRINRFGTYRNTITVTSKGGVVRTGVVNVPVTATPSQCP